jgi:phospholipid-translocating ATPase
MNLYFIIIGRLQLWSAVSPVNPITTWGPILFIFMIAFIREGIDDYHQHQMDNIINNIPYEVIRDFNFFKHRVK